VGRGGLTPVVDISTPAVLSRGSGALACVPSSRSCDRARVATGLSGVRTFRDRRSRSDALSVNKTGAEVCLCPEVGSVSNETKESQQ
jgi:hypothetical protein